MCDQKQPGIAEQLGSGELKGLGPKDTFAFACVDECMGRCCHKITILLDPWDIEVMARHLGIAGQQFFKDYCTMELDRQLGWPVVWLTQAQQGHCNFMLPDGKCSIYPARSRNCRTYPLGRAVRFADTSGGAKDKQELIFMVEQAQGCLGHNAGPVWTVQQWLSDAQATEFYAMSDQYAALIDYARRDLGVASWINPNIVKMMLPFLFAPDILRQKLNLDEQKVSHRQLHYRRIQALGLLLADMAAQFGFGAGAKDEAGNLKESLMDRVQAVLLGTDQAHTPWLDAYD